MPSWAHGHPGACRPQKGNDWVGFLLISPTEGWKWLPSGGLSTKPNWYVLQEVRSQLHLPVLIVWRRLLSLQNVDVCWGTTRVDLKHVPVFSQFFKQNLAFRAWTYSMPAFCSHFSESVGSWISTFKKDFLSYVAVLFTPENDSILHPSIINKLKMTIEQFLNSLLLK